MRKLIDHRVPGSANDSLQIEVVDSPDPRAGAHHCYAITGFDTNTNPSATEPFTHKLVVLFQNGPIPEVGVNGVTHETLLAIVADRLMAYQSGPYGCTENANALLHVMSALQQLKQRTQDRLLRKVEGTMAK
jgi:hypothetical protein